MKKRLISEILLTITIAALVSLSLFYIIYLIALFPLGFHMGMTVAAFSSTGIFFFLVGYKVRSLLKNYRGTPQ